MRFPRLNPVNPASLHLIAGLALICLPAAGQAGERHICVTCTAPDQTYTCIVQDTTAGAAGQSLQLYCIYELAQRGNHASCKARRAAPQTCDGVVAILDEGGTGRAPDTTRAAIGPEALEEPEGLEGDTQSTTADRTGPPRTLIEATGQVIDSSKRGIEQTGQNVKRSAEKASAAIGSAAKSAYDCVMSLFTECN